MMSGLKNLPTHQVMVCLWPCWLRGSPMLILRQRRGSLPPENMLREEGKALFSYGDLGWEPNMTPGLKNWPTHEVMVCLRPCWHQGPPVLISRQRRGSLPLENVHCKEGKVLFSHRDLGWEPNKMSRLKNLPTHEVMVCLQPCWHRGPPMLICGRGGEACLRKTCLVRKVRHFFDTGT